MWSARRFLESKPTKFSRIRQCMNLYRRQINIFSLYDTTLLNNTLVIKYIKCDVKMLDFCHTDRLFSRLVYHKL
jgi:hypothetical protein